MKSLAKLVTILEEFPMIFSKLCTNLSNQLGFDI